MLMCETPPMTGTRSLEAFLTFYFKGFKVKFLSLYYIYFAALAFGTAKPHMLHAEFISAPAAAQHGRKYREIKLGALCGSALAQKVKIFLNAFGNYPAELAHNELYSYNPQCAAFARLVKSGV